MLEPTQVLSEKERRFRDTRYHQYSKSIVDFAVQQGAGVLQLEDLDQLKDEKQDYYILRDWAVADLQNKLKYKASEHGIEIKYLNPQYTSQRCSECGHIEKANRPDQKTFICKSCGVKMNADYNAAKNLSIKNIDEIIIGEIANREQS